MSNKLSNASLVGFVPSTNLNSAANFYSKKLGLKLIHQDDYALVFDNNHSKLRVAKVNEKVTAAYTVAGWEVEDINTTAEELHRAGIKFILYQGMPQDDNGICTFPSGSKVAWFNDPDGNVLSITQN